MCVFFLIEMAEKRMNEPLQLARLPYYMCMVSRFVENDVVVVCLRVYNERHSMHVKHYGKFFNNSFFLLAVMRSLRISGVFCF